MRRAREKLKADPEKYEEVKRKDKERKKSSRKKICEMSDREKRKIRKGWRERAKKHREKIKEIEQALLIVGTPPQSPQHHDVPENTPSHSRVASGYKKRKQNRELMKIELDKLKEQNMKLKRQRDKYKQKYFRAVSKKDDTPKKDVKKMLSGKKVPEIIRQNLEFGAVLKKQINENFKKEVVLSKKRTLVSMITGKIIKKYRFMKKISLLTSKNLLKPKVGLQKRKLHQKVKLQNLIISFLENDDNSRLCPGKKDTITKRKQKKQKRLLSDSLKNLHQKFTDTFPEHKDLSYPQFCRGRPF
ncbi:uncharacterized protein LOC129230093 [Uloborus diversus]|uniref:uncharacterized protein LOC129230093 n=1 Tax=Uloborus diversus TaxID=327109 RepID=UPI00240A69F8|nr:uncharacterized protein LOC129230093 [Uloborus diversus]